jgi:hypothetical protein
MRARYIVGLLCVALAGPWVGSALAQPAADLNPAVNTSAPQPPPADAAPAPAPVAQQAQASHADPAQPAPARVATSAPAPAETPAAATTPGSAGSSDRIELGTTEISGNRELPKLMYIVPWQRAAVGKVTGRPPNSLVDEALTPVDRSVFERQNSYYAALQAASTSAASQPDASAASPAAAAPRDEK